MSATLTILDETTAGQRSIARKLDFPTNRTTVKEIIRKRIFEEVSEFNSNQNATFHGLVQPTEAEQTLNASVPKRPREVDWMKQFIAALEAFESNRIIVLINEKQATDLDEEFEIQPGAEVSFLKLVPLVGG